MAQYYVFLFLSPLALILVASALYWTFKHKSSDCGWRLIINLFIVAGFITLSALELLSKSERGTLLFARHNFIFLSLTPVSWFCFSLCYCGFKKLLKPGIIWMYFLIPTVTIFLALSGFRFSLIWESFTFEVLGPFRIMHVTNGLWYWIQTPYSYSLVVAGAVLIGRQFFMAGDMYSRRSVLIVVGAITPLAVHFLFSVRIIPGFVKDFTPITFAFSGFLYVVGMYRYRLLDIMPVAHHALMDELDDGILVLDRGMRMVEANPKARRICGIQLSDIGRPSERVALIKQIIERFHQGEKERQIKLKRYDTDHYYLVRTVAIPRKRGGGFSAYIVTFRPVTELVETINRLKEALKEIKTLQDIIPICASCKKIRTDEGYWEQVDGYISRNLDVLFSHCLCDECAKKLYPGYS